MNKQDFFKIEEKIKGLKTVYRREPSEKFMFSSKSRLINRLILDEKEKVLKSKWVFGPKFTVGFLVIIFVLAMGLGSAVSKKAIPGQILYPLKRFNESLIVATTLSPEQKAMFKVEITKRRVDEIVQLVDEEQYEDVEKATQELKEAVEESKNEIEKLPEDKQQKSKDAAAKLYKQKKEELEKAAEKSDDETRSRIKAAIKILEEEYENEDESENEDKESEVKGKKKEIKDTSKESDDKGSDNKKGKD